MTRIGSLRVKREDGLPFAREKLRVTLLLAGLRQVIAGQVTAQLSHAIRADLPAELTVELGSTSQALLLQPASLAGPHARIELPAPVSETAVEAMRQALGRLTLEELMSDLEYQVEERTAELRRERERSERLLKNMLPDVIAERMKLGETIADRHEGTVIFTDIKGFTELARHRSAEDVVILLDRIFSRFDELAARHQLEKIKTIGDCYMAVAGLPLPNPQVDHVDRAVMMGLDMIAVMPEIRESLGIEVDVRVGVHTGPMVAGVIGTKKYAYDIWGDTVNVASRMESHGLPGRLHVSDDVRNLLGERFMVERRGTIDIKNRGSIDTWFVNGLATF